MSELRLPGNIRVAIGLLGYVGSGKTTLASEVAAAARGTAHYSFASGVREVTAAVLSHRLTPFDLMSQAHKELPVAPGAGSVRAMMEAIGSAARSVWPDVWVAMLAQRVEDDAFSAGALVVDDVRHWNEVELLRTAPVSRFFWLRHPQRPAYLGATDLWAAAVRGRLAESGDIIEVDPRTVAGVSEVVEAITQGQRR